MNLFKRINESKIIFRIGEIFIFGFEALLNIFKKPFEKKEILKQMYEIGVSSLPVVSLTSLFTGMVFSLQTYLGFKKLGAEVYSASVMGVSLAKELVPVLVGLMVAGRVGAAIAAELGTMKVTEQIDALFTMGTDPVKFLASPRLTAAAIMLPVLVIYGDIIGLSGAYIVDVLIMGMNYNNFYDTLMVHFEVWDIITGLIKAFSFGIIIASVSSYYGMKTEGGAEGVGKATTFAVVTSSVVILIADFVWGKILPFTLKG